MIHVNLAYLIPFKEDPAILHLLPCPTPIKIEAGSTGHIAHLCALYDIPPSTDTSPFVFHTEHKSAFHVVKWKKRKMSKEIRKDPTVKKKKKIEPKKKKPRYKISRHMDNKEINILKKVYVEMFIDEQKKEEDIYNKMASKMWRDTGKKRGGGQLQGFCAGNNNPIFAEPVMEVSDSHVFPATIQGSLPFTVPLAVRIPSPSPAEEILGNFQELQRRKELRHQQREKIRAAEMK